MSKLRIYNVPEEEMLEALDTRVSSSVAGAIESLSEKMANLEDQFFALKKVLTHKEIALYCDVETKTVLHWIHNEGLPASKRGRIFYSKRDELEQWLIDNPKKSTQKQSDSQNQAA